VTDHDYQQQQAPTQYDAPQQAPTQYDAPQSHQQQFPQQQNYRAGADEGVIGKRRNPFASWIGLPIITLGIYHLVWIYKTNKEMARFDQRIVVNPALSVLAFFPGFLLIVPPFVAAWRLSSRVAAAQRAAGEPECSPILAFILWMFVASTGVLYLQFEINKIWDRYPGAHEGQQVSLHA